MFKFLKSKKTLTSAPESEILTEVDEDKASNSTNWFNRLTKGLTKTRLYFVDRLSNLVLGKKEIDAELLEELETILLSADVGVEVCDRLLTQVKQQVARKELNDPQLLLTILKKQLLTLLIPCAQNLILHDKPFVILMVGINGAGKTTTIAKLAHFYQEKGKKVILAAGDTFRAAAIEQLQVWGERNNVPVIAQHTGADSASVIFDAMQAAKARDYDVLIADTAGRLHTQQNLMQELMKIKKVLKKIDPEAPQEIMLVIDAGTGQNALNQANQFNQAVGLTGITLTKLDGTAHGGVIFAIAEQLKLPIRFIGVGERLEDLKPFDAVEFVQALFATQNNKLPENTPL